MSKVASAFTLASAGVLTAALFVRPAVSPPPPSNTPSPRAVVVKAAKNAAQNANVIAPGAVGAPAAVIPKPLRAFSVDIVGYAAWGSGTTELGHTLPSEAMPEAPMSLAVD